MMKKTILLSTLLVLATMGGQAANEGHAVSPNGKLTLSQKSLGYAVCYDNRAIIELPTVGMEGMAADEIPSPTFKGKVTDDYTMLSGKQKHCTNEANEYTVTLGDGLTMVWRLYDDGVTFRYELSDLKGGHLPQERTTYRIPEGTKRWMQQWADSYEGFFPLSTTARVKAVPSYSGQHLSAEGYNCRWGYPALLEPVPGVFALITEANIERRQSASCLWNDKDAELYRVVPDANEAAITGDWHSPWRVLIIGELKDVVASTLVTDVSEPCRLTDTGWIHPGVVSWVYWAYNHGSNDLAIIKRYVDMAATLELPYVLIDAEWDEMKDGHSIDEAIAYAKSRGVRPMIWYNSSVGWVDGAPGPKFRLNRPEDREREFAWCERLGVAGVKIDFFSGDNQMNMDYCLDLLESAARHHLLVNFHGATIPRGWQRTYPNLLSTEGVYGAEWYNNVPTFTDRAAAHNATLPFTRNVIGPMDYTPCAFSDSQHPHITTHAHELALTVLFESGLQHLADRPESFLAQPQAVKDFLGLLPASWDETRLVAGYPGEYVVVARRSGDTWYVAGINGTDVPQVIPLTMPMEDGVAQTATLFSDSGHADNPWAITSASPLPTSLICQARGGFVAVITKGNIPSHK